MRMQDALLDVAGVHTYIGSSHILQGVSLNATRGQTTVLLGRNGAGKSTTLRTILGLWAPRRGSIELDGQSISGRPAHVVARKGVGFIPEDREVFAALTVDENLRLSRRRSGRIKGAGTSTTVGIDEVYRLFPDLYAARKRSAGAMSGGQQQMLAIGRALVNRNQILLVDEPTKGLAPVIVQQLIEIFTRLKERGETMLLVEQNLEFARSVGDRYFIVDEGRIVHGGPMDDLESRSEILRQYVGV